MEIRNYLSRDRVHYSIILKDLENQAFQLWEHVDGMQREFHNMLAVVYSWRAELVKNFLDALIFQYHDNKKTRVRPIQVTLDSEENYDDLHAVYWNRDYRLPEEIAMKLLVGMKLSSTMDQRPRIEEALEVLASLSDEEVSFWAWKTLSLKTAAMNGFKAMYL